MKLDSSTLTKVIYDFIENHVPGKKVILCGASMGGWAAMIYSSVYPEHLLGVVLNGCLMNTQKWSFGFGKAAMKLIMMMDEQTRVNLGYKHLCSEIGEEKTKDLFKGGMFYECWTEMWEMIGKCDFIHYVSMINVPVLFLLTDKDTNNFNEKEFLEAARDYKRVMKDGHHEYAIENPAQFALEIHQFIKEKILPLKAT